MKILKDDNFKFKEPENKTQNLTRRGGGWRRLVKGEGMRGRRDVDEENLRRDELRASPIQPKVEVRDDVHQGDHVGRTAVGATRSSIIPTSNRPVIVSLKILCVPRSGDCHARSIRSSHEPGPPFLPSPKGAGSLAVF